MKRTACFTLQNVKIAKDAHHHLKDCHCNTAATHKQTASQQLAQQWKVSLVSFSKDSPTFVGYPCSNLNLLLFKAHLKLSVPVGLLVLGQYRGWDTWPQNKHWGTFQLFPLSPPSTTSRPVFKIIIRTGHWPTLEKNRRKKNKCYVFCTKRLFTQSNAEQLTPWMHFCDIDEFFPLKQAFLHKHISICTADTHSHSLSSHLRGSKHWCNINAFKCDSFHLEVGFLKRSTSNMKQTFCFWSIGPSPTTFI